MTTNIMLCDEKYTPGRDMATYSWSLSHSYKQYTEYCQLSDVKPVDFTEYKDIYTELDHQLDKCNEVR